MNPPAARSGAPNAVPFSMPPEFDGERYNEINAKLAPFSRSHEPAWRSFASGWMGVAGRFRAAAETNAVFAESIARSTAPPGDERFLQDHALFVFCLAMLSTVECFSFAVYAAGAVIDPAPFPLSTEQDLRFYPKDVVKALAAAFPNEPLAGSLGETIAHAQYQTILELRNYLGHRGGLPRMSYMSNIPGNDRPSTVPGNAQAPSAGWQFTLELTPALTGEAYRFLADRVRRLQHDFLSLLQARL